jgi:hypothetical protein
MAEGPPGLESPLSLYLKTRQIQGFDAAMTNQQTQSISLAQTDKMSNWKAAQHKLKQRDLEAQAIRAREIETLNSTLKNIKAQREADERSWQTKTSQPDFGSLYHIANKIASYTSVEHLQQSLNDFGFASGSSPGRLPTGEILEAMETIGLHLVDKELNTLVCNVRVLTDGTIRVGSLVELLSRVSCQAQFLGWSVHNDFQVADATIRERPTENISGHLRRALLRRSIGLIDFFLENDRDGDGILNTVDLYNGLQVRHLMCSLTRRRRAYISIYRMCTLAAPRVRCSWPRPRTNSICSRCRSTLTLWTS